MSVLDLVHRNRRSFVFSNALGIVVFAGAALVLGERFWAFFDVPVAGSPLVRLLAWYLLVHGAAGLLVARAPERQPAVLVAIGLEKVGAAACFLALLTSDPRRMALAAIGAFDALMAVVFLLYGWRADRDRRRGSPPVT